MVRFRLPASVSAIETVVVASGCAEYGCRDWQKRGSEGRRTADRANHRWATRGASPDTRAISAA